MTHKIWIASDHGGFDLKQAVFDKLKHSHLIEIEDMGCYKKESCDYPVFAKEVCNRVREYGGLGVLICTTGQGMCMTANAQPDIRAALVYRESICRMAREHNNANVMCIGADGTNVDDVSKWIYTFIATPFSTEERHIRRVKQIKN
jgi:ribose 5-phosphate isomerase B